MRWFKNFGLAAILSTCFYPNNLDAQTVGVGIYPPLESTNVYEKIPQRAMVVLANAAFTGLVSKLHENSFWDAFKKSLPIHAAAETVYTLNSSWIDTSFEDNLLPYLAGQLENSLSTNIASGKPFCENINIRYNFINLNFDCGEINAEIDYLAFPEMGFHFLTGGNLEIEKSVKRGIPVFSYLQDNHPLRFLGVGGIENSKKLANLGTAFPRSVTYVKQNIMIDNLNARLEFIQSGAANSLNSQEDLEKAVNYLEQGIKSYRGLHAETLNEEMNHSRQYDLSSKTINSFDSVPLWIRYPIKIPGIKKEIDLPIFETFFIGLNLFIPDESLRPVELGPRLERRSKKSIQPHLALNFGLDWLDFKNLKN